MPARSDKPAAVKILDLAAYSRARVSEASVAVNDAPRSYLDDMAGYLRRRADVYQAQNWHLFAHMLRQEADRILEDDAADI